MSLPQYPKKIFPEVFCIKIFFLHLISHGLEGVNKNSCSRLGLCYKCLCSSIFSKGTQSFDLIKHNITQKLAYKVDALVKLMKV